jgi:hypothetical protein
VELLGTVRVSGSDHAVQVLTTAKAVAGRVTVSPPIATPALEAASSDSLPSIAGPTM